MRIPGTRKTVPKYFMQIVNSYGSGESFGLIAIDAISRGVRRAARIVTKTDCHLATITKDQY